MKTDLTRGSTTRSSRSPATIARCALAAAAAGCTLCAGCATVPDSSSTELADKQYVTGSRIPVRERRDGSVTSVSGDAFRDAMRAGAPASPPVGGGL